MLLPFAGVPHLRRDFLRRGAGLAVAGYALPHWGAAAPVDNALQAALTRSSGRAKSCILVYLLGGPPHLDMFDLKPLAPAEIRGPFKPIATNVPGIEICEHFPLLSRMAGIRTARTSKACKASCCQWSTRACRPCWTTEPIPPVDVHATMYHALGINPHQVITDPFGRPFEICTGSVIRQLI